MYGPGHSHLQIIDWYDQTVPVMDMSLRVSECEQLNDSCGQHPLTAKFTLFITVLYMSKSSTISYVMDRYTHTAQGHCEYYERRYICDCERHVKEEDAV